MDEAVVYGQRLRDRAGNEIEKQENENAGMKERTMKVGMAVRLGLAIAGVLLAGTAASAQVPGGGPGMGPGPGFGQHRPPFEKAFGGPGNEGRWWNNAKLVAELKLTDAQRKSMDDILLTHREKLIDLRASLEKAELFLEPLIKADQPNEAQILAGIDRVAQSRAELEKANARFLLAIRGKLTPEQWKQLQADRERHGPEGRGGFGRDGEGRGGPDGEGRQGWRPGPPGPGEQGPGAQFKHRQGPPPPAGAAPAQDAAPASGAAPAVPGPQTKDSGAGADHSQGGAQQ
jgi:Spy/CpxP family protein refolding chaperone